MSSAGGGSGHVRRCASGALAFPEELELLDELDELDELEELEELDELEELEELDELEELEELELLEDELLLELDDELSGVLLPIHPLSTIDSSTAAQGVGRRASKCFFIVHSLICYIL